jgi:hypothetical protein
VSPVLHVFGFLPQSARMPVPLVPDVLLLPPPPLLEHAVSPSAIAAIPARIALPLWTLTGE